MSVNPGFPAQEFIPSVIQKIKKIRELINKSGKDIRLEIDGGVKLSNIEDIHQAGVDTFVIGSAIFNTPDYIDIMNKFNAKLNREKETENA
jgi:ribulose-phosphate 3-epimerase